MGSDNIKGRFASRKKHFNPRSRVGSDLGCSGGGKVDVDFNPRSRVGSDSLIVKVDGLTEISIHAPAWGATEEFKDCVPQNGISIHAPAWGATRALSPAHRHSDHFNPRSRVGSDTPYIYHKA